MTAGISTGARIRINGGKVFSWVEAVSEMLSDLGAFATYDGCTLLTEVFRRDNIIEFAYYQTDNAAGTIDKDVADKIQISTLKENIVSGRKPLLDFIVMAVRYNESLHKAGFLEETT